MCRRRRSDRVWEEYTSVSPRLRSPSSERNEPRLNPLLSSPRGAPGRTPPILVGIGLGFGESCDSLYSTEEGRSDYRSE
jgi:hypothetical protein